VGDTVEIAWESVGGGHDPWTATVTATDKGKGGLTVVYASDGSADVIECRDVPFCVTRAGGGDGHGAPAAEEGHTCVFCDKRFQRRSKLEVHERVHTEEKPFSCSFCDKRFAQKSNATAHERVHTGAQPAKNHACACAASDSTRPSARAGHTRERLL